MGKAHSRCLWLLNQTAESHSALLSPSAICSSVWIQGKLPDGCRDSEAMAHVTSAPLASRAISGALLVWSSEAETAERQEIEMARLLRAVSDRGQAHTE